MARNKQGKHPAHRASDTVQREGGRPDDREQAFAQEIEVQSYFSGPLPAPQNLSEYDQILPGAADRIVTMAEREAAHRHRIQNRSLWFNGAAQILGLIIAGVIGMTAVGGGIWLMYEGRVSDWTGVGVALSGLAALVGVFVAGKRSSIKAEERASK